MSKPSSTDAPEAIKISDELKDSLKEIAKSCKKEDEEIFKAMRRQWKKAEEFWKGVQYLFWDSTSEAWASPMLESLNNVVDLDEEDEDQVGSFSDKVVDIYKAHGESIISALAAQLPAVRFLPDDADETQDVITARTYSKIAELIIRHNKAKLVFLKALFYLANQGIVASYRYKDSDFKYGSYKVPSFGSQETESKKFICKVCGYESDVDWSAGSLNDAAGATASAKDADGNSGKHQPFEYTPDATVSDSDDAGAVASTTTCPQCHEPGKPKVEKVTGEVPVQTGIEDRPKTRVKLDIFGPLHFKVSYYARNQSECNYLGLLLYQGKDTICELYPDKYDDIEKEQADVSEGFTRSVFQYPAEQEIESRHILPVSRWWFRPAIFNRETKKHLREELKKKFPDGCKVTLIGKTEIFAAVEPDKFDDRWEIGQAGLSTYIYSDAILRPLIQIQEIRNQLINLIIETIEHGIPSEFADPEILNFDTYGRFEAVPGFIYKTKPGRPSEPIGNAFYTSSRATLSREVAMFLKQIDEDAQFAVGSYPANYGGPSQGKSRTFAEYAMSGQMALRRQSITWALIVDWWIRTIAGCVNMFVDTVVEDEKYTQFKDGNYMNVWIKRSQLTGKVGGVEPESAEGFPISIAQKKDLYIKLMELNNDFINNALYKPDNAKILQDTMGLTELRLPGEEQRIKQVIEIGELIKDGAEPVPTSQIAPDGQENMISSVPIDSNVDDHQVHIETLISFMVDLPGLDLLREKPEAYANLTAHLRMHQQAMAQAMMSAGTTPPGKPEPTAQAGVEQ